VKWRIRNQSIDLTQRALIMGILNTTPDSFSDGGNFQEVTHARSHALRMIEEGADIIDVGGESTRPGAPEVDVTEELQRVIPVIRMLRSEWHGWISIDTTKSVVARAALEAGADIVNDVSGLRADHAMIGVCKEFRPGVVVMHMQGTPRTMQQQPRYENVVAEVREFFAQRYRDLLDAGLDAESICFDPGIGFGKTPAHNRSLLQNLPQLIVENRPLLLGVSRKSFIGHLLGSADLSQRMWPTVAMTSLGREQGAMIHRVHDVRANVDSLRMTEALIGCYPSHSG
jgi:dihydropteroate synthase